MRRVLAAAAVCLAAWSCLTIAPTPPAFHVEDVPRAVAARLTLKQQIAADEVWASLKQGRPDQARRNLLKLGPDNPVYPVGMGYVSLAGGDTESAESQFKDCLARFPEMTPANAGLAQIYEGRGEKEPALAQYRAILERDPDNAWAGPRFEALRKEVTASLLQEARAFEAAGRKDDARKALLKVISFDPNSADANYLLGTSYLEAGDAERALPYFRTFMANDRTRTEKTKEFLRTLAERFYQKGELGRSLDCYEQLAELEPGDKAVAARVAELKDKLGVYELPSQYGLIASEEAVMREDLAALIAVRFKSFLDGPGAQTPILVDIATSWAQPFIIKVAAAGVMGVYENHTFQPRRVVNRAELAEALAALIDLLKGRGVRLVPPADARRIQVADVPADSFYHPFVLKVLSYQVMDLIMPQRTFEPERNVPGREAARGLDLLLRLTK